MSDAAASNPLGRDRQVAARARRGGFAQLVRTEFKLLMREPWLMGWAVLFPVVLLIIIGATTSGKPQHSLGGLRFIVVYAPTLEMFSMTLLSLSAMPSNLANYRDKGYLRRLSTTPIGALRLIVAQIVIVVAISVATVVLIVLLAHFCFTVPFPSQFGGFVIAILLTLAALSALGMLVAALAPTQRVAGAVGGMLFFPMMFFAGLWVPQQEMGALLRHISQYTPLGAAVPAISSAQAGQFPAASHLIVLAVWAAVLTRIAVRVFRWDK